MTAMNPPNRFSRSALIKVFLAVLLGLILSQCGYIDNEWLCNDYAAKMVECGAVDAVDEEDTAASCLAILDAGGDSSEYECVVDNICDDIGTECGI